MKTATVRELRHAFPKVLRWIQQGETVTLTKRGKPVALVSPPPAPKPRKIQWPDFAARARAYCGDTVLTDADIKRMKDEEEREFR
jgi:antitoxin (DNA-binding transcriptional repressor) of toxin-antitoxin stability system